MNHSKSISEQIAPLNDRLRSHPLYEAMKSVEDVRVFMENHVFAVWDFMTILKSLQRSLTCVETVWLPSGNTLARRLVNEIVLCEESDEDEKAHIELRLAEAHMPRPIV